MKEPHRKGVANHPDPESCAGGGNIAGEALAGAHAGQLLSSEITSIGVPTLCDEGEGHTRERDLCECSLDAAESETLSMRGNSVRGNRETPGVSLPNTARRAVAGRERSEKAGGRTSDMHVSGESDSSVVPRKRANKAGLSAAESVEGRGPTKGNATRTLLAPDTGPGKRGMGLWGVREAARRDKKQRFTALLHHVTPELLQASYFELKRSATPGVDGVTWQEYGQRLEERILDLHDRVHRGAYRAQPSKRAWIPKADGRQRPLGIAALEDKIVQQAIKTVLEQIYEEEFLGFSYGFRPGRSCHNGLDALWVGIMQRKVGWVLDADIRGFFDNIDHEWLLRFLEHRIADRRILRLIRKWLRAGVSEDGQWSRTTVGTPQGSVISPMLANVFLHYVFDLWVNQWRKRHARGEVIVVRYADDFVMGFQHRDDAERCLRELRERFAKFGLELHPDKTRLIEFGRYAAERRARRGEGKPETFNFLGFTHCCGKTRKGAFAIKRRSIAKRMRATLQEIKQLLIRRMHSPVVEVGRWLGSVVRGWFNYHAVPGNRTCLDQFRTHVARMWLHVVRRRSQKGRHWTWERMKRLTKRWLPKAQILHPYPNERLIVKHPR
jgi:RNA-directed DNA polymerase